MKKTYIKPATATKDLQLEGLIAASLKLHNGEGAPEVDTQNGGQLSSRYESPWSSSNWTVK